VISYAANCHSCGMTVVFFDGGRYVEMPSPGSGCVIAGGYLLNECVDSAAVQIRSVQSHSIDWTWLVVIGWAAV